MLRAVRTRRSAPAVHRPVRTPKSGVAKRSYTTVTPISVRQYFNLKPEATEAEVLAKAHATHKDFPIEIRLPLKWRPEKVQSQEERLKRILMFRAAVCHHLIENGIEFQVESDFEFPEGPRFLGGSFGTPDRPVLVPSWSEQKERVVGCTGGPGVHEHDLIWHNVKQEKPCVCLECGQTFKLVGYDEFLEWAAHAHEQGHKIEKWWHEP